MLFKNSLIYLLSSTINRSIPFLMLPILTKYLTPTEFGLWSIYQVFISFLLPLIGMNMHSNITRNFHKRKKEFLLKVIYNLLVFLTAASVIVLIVLLIVYMFIDQLFGIDTQYLLLLPILLFFQLLNIFNLTIYRNENRAYMYGVFEIGITFINISLATLLIVSFSYTWTGMVYGILFAQVFFSFFSLKSMYRNGYIKVGFNKLILKNLILLSLPLIPHALADVLIQLSDRLFIETMISAEAVGIYTVATYFGFIVYILTTSFNKSWTPYMVKKLASNDYNDKVRLVKYTYLYFPITFVIAFLVVVFSYYAMPYMVDERYHSSFELIPWITVGFVIRGSYSMVFPYFLYKGKTMILAKIAIFGAFVNVILNYLMIKEYGLVGAAIATIISFFILTLITWIYSHKIYPMPWFYFFKKVEKCN